MITLIMKVLIHYARVFLLCTKAPFAQWKPSPYEGLCRCEEEFYLWQCNNQIHKNQQGAYHNIHDKGDNTSSLRNFSNTNNQPPTVPAPAPI